MAEPARILEQGYRSYEGERGGIGAAIATTTKHGIQRALGMKRTIWQKVLPVLSITFAFLPAIVFVGIAALIDKAEIGTDFGPSYPEYYGFVTAAILLFTAFVAPEILCTDRRSGMLGLYLASPLNRNTYLMAKVFSVLTILSIVTIGPVLLMMIGKTIVGQGPDGLDGWLKTFGQILLSGAAISMLHASLSLAVSSVTSRRAVASAGIVILLIVSSVTSGVLIEAGGSPNLQMLDLFNMPFQLVYRIYGERVSNADRFDEISTTLLVVANVGWTLLFSFVMWWRYRKLTVTK